MDFSFIIPCYNAAATIGRCLDSIYSQGLDNACFEVICVDDCSPDTSTSQAINTYTYQNEHPENLRLIRHTENKRAGGARNTAIRAAQGDYLLTIDCDDYYLEGTLPQLLEAKRSNNGLDFIMFNFVNDTDGHLSAPHYAESTSTDVMTGPEFLRRQQVPWTAWIYMYRRPLFEEKGIWFVENTVVDDTGTVLQFTAEARQCRYVPVTAYCYVTNPNQGSIVGSNPRKIINLFCLSDQLMQLSFDQQAKNAEAANCIRGHAVFHRRKDLQRFAWRLPAAQRLSILRQHAFPVKTGDRLVDFCSRNPRLASSLMTLAAPFLHIAWQLKRRLQH